MTTIIASADMEQIANDLEFAESGGGPLIALPKAAVPWWWGVFDEGGEMTEGGNQYELACNAGNGELVPVGDHRAIVLAAPDITAFYPLGDDGGLLLRWVGADTAAGLAAAMVAVPDESWVDTGSVFNAPGGECQIMDSGDDGRNPMEPVSTFMLPAGRYAILATEERQCEVETSDGVEEVMANALRLRLLADD